MTNRQLLHLIKLAMTFSDNLMIQRNRPFHAAKLLCIHVISMMSMRYKIKSEIITLISVQFREQRIQIMQLISRILYVNQIL